MSGYDITSVVDMYLTREPEPAEIHAVIVAAIDTAIYVILTSLKK